MRLLVVALVVFILPLGCKSRFNTAAPGKTGSSGLSDINMKLPEKKMFSDDPTRQAMVNGYTLVFTATTPGDCTKFGEQKPWETSQLKVKVVNTCDYDVAMTVGTLDGPNPFYTAEGKLTAKQMDESRARGETAVPLVMTLKLTPMGQKLGFKGEVPTTIGEVDVAVDVQVDGTPIPFADVKTELTRLLKLPNLDVKDFGGDKTKIVDIGAFEWFNRYKDPVTGETKSNQMDYSLSQIEKLVADKKAPSGACGSVRAIAINADKNLRYNKVTGEAETRMKAYLKYAKALDKTFPCNAATTP